MPCQYGRMRMDAPGTVSVGARHAVPPQALGRVERQLLFDPGRCIGCKSCASACYLGHVEVPGLYYEDMKGSAAMPAICRQCEEAPCVAACPNDAMYEDECGIVRRSPVRCTGCRCCALGCPFGVIDQEIVRRQVGKCDLCADRTGSSRGFTPRGTHVSACTEARRSAPTNGLPRCVGICPSGALKFAKLDEELARAGYVLLSGRTVSQM